MRLPQFTRLGHRSSSTCAITTLSSSDSDKLYNYLHLCDDYRPVSKMDAVWEEVKEEVESGNLGAIAAKVSTMRPNSNATDSNTKVICVYSTEEDMDKVGLKLIKVVKGTIRYKTDVSTLLGQYASRGSKKTTCRSLKWNDGAPIFGD